MGSRRPPSFTKLIADLGRQLADRNLPYMLIGGQAVLLHGRPRLTEDIDVTLGFGPDALPRVIEVCETLGLELLPDDVDSFVTETFVLPSRFAARGIRVDFIFSTTLYERQAIERVVHVELEGVPVAFAAAEDLIIHKLFAGRPRDIEDAAGVVQRSGGDLDWHYLEYWTREFSSVPGREDMPERLSDLRNQL